MNTDGESNEANNSLRMSLRERPRKLHAERKLRERCDELKFLDDFDPEKSNREKRKLKRKATSSFIGGIGIPTDLTYESLTIGYVLKAEFWLPWNSTVFYENPYLPQYKQISYSRRHFKRDMDHKTTLRWDIYQTLIETLNGYGYKGQECVLKAICEANAVPFRRDYSVFDELMHIFFSPSRSCDLKSEDSQHFLEAAKLGQNGDSSCELYECSLSLLELISTIF
uniref:Uncharacterized protein n=1 Tax=Glossina morsitans morsitans TaxID=37546 RepID=A0A1B0GC94_GLOMM